MASAGDPSRHRDDADGCSLMSIYSDAANPDLVDRIPLSARSVLDVGCGTGALAAEYLRRNPAATMVGIERDTAAAAIARRRMHTVLEGDVERDPLPFRGNLPKGGFDCIVYGDVLEHFQDPWAVLRQQMQALAPGGLVLVCMPNVEHWSFVERLLRGTWNYEPQGLFDRTHLRWFSLESTRRALVDAGLQPIDVKGRVFNVEAAERFVQAMHPALRALGIDSHSYLNRATPLQHVWRASRRPQPQIAIVSSKLAPIGGVSEVRVVQPMLALSTDPGLATQIVEQAELPRVPEGMPCIFVLHRPALLGEGGISTLRALLAKGYLLVCEFDDHPDYIPVLQNQDVLNFRGVHAVQTSTEPLAEFLRPQNPEVVVLPNGVARLPEVRSFSRSDRLTVFFGGINRENDWPLLLPALNSVAALAGDRLNFQVIADRAFFEALATEHKVFTPLCDYPTYLEILSRSDICFMPLADTPFNRCKSDLKFLEASASGLASLASDVVYRDSIEEGRTGLLFRDANELRHQLARMVANPAWTRELAMAARAHVAKNRMLAYQMARRSAWYRSLWARRRELTEALYARVPELAPREVAP